MTKHVVLVDADEYADTCATVAKIIELVTEASLPNPGAPVADLLTAARGMLLTMTGRLTGMQRGEVRPVLGGSGCTCSQLYCLS